MKISYKICNFLKRFRASDKLAAYLFFVLKSRELGYEWKRIIKAIWL